MQPAGVFPEGECLREVGVVAIGRNEGDRLHACLRSMAGGVAGVVYVDSGSTDGSVDFARGLGVDVVELETSVPFTAARARNAGFERLLARHPEIRWVQFIDGDCQLVPGWLRAASERLAGEPSLAAVCGRRRERFRDASIYNRLADMEWNSPVGRARACGGDALYRVDALRSVGGFDPRLICGEEPELCLRLRRAGGEIERMDREMTLHDAAMFRFAQWWKRATRAGWALAEGVAMHGAAPERHNVRPALSAWFWAAGVPLAALVLGPPSGWLSIPAVVVVYALLWLRVIQHRLRRGDLRADAALYATFCVLAKFPAVTGQLRWFRARWLGTRASLIEYKEQSRPSSAESDASR